MRIAISGSHRVGKSTLVEALSELLPKYVTVEEPYNQMEEEGYEFAATPSLEDFEAQLTRSIADLRESDDHTLFDRCPADFLGYLSVHEDGDAFDLDGWIHRVRKAMRKLDLVVLVGIERPDRIDLSATDDEELRTAVDECLKELLVEDAHDLGVAVLEVKGDPVARAKQVIKRLSVMRS